MYDRHRASEAAKHLAELDPDIAAAEDDEVLGDGVELHQGSRRQKPDIRETVYIRDRGLRAGIDEEPRSGELELVSDYDAARVRKTRFAKDQLDVLFSLETFAASAAEEVYDGALALPNAVELDVHSTGTHAVVTCTTGQVSHPRARNHRLGWGAAVDDAGAADSVVALDDGCLLSGFGERFGQRFARLAGSDDDGVVGL